MDELSPFFTSKGLHLTRVIEDSDYFTLYQAERTDTGDWAAVSLYKGLGAAEWERTAAALACQYELKDVSGVVQISEFNTWTVGEGVWTIFSVEEWVEKDLAKDIEDRKQNRCVWSEEVLLNITGNCVSTLAEMQRLGVAHRSINLHSLRYDLATQMVKLSGFSQACKVTNDPISVVWTSHMSPELANLVAMRTEIALYDPFKADVYSLGVCLLSCCCWDLRGPEEVEKNLLSRLQSVQSLKLRSLLYCMLQREPQNRPNFLDLKQYLLSFGPCPGLSCPHASTSYYYHLPCHGKFCQSCTYFKDYAVYCPICSTQYLFAPVQAITPAPVPGEEEMEIHIHTDREEQRGVNEPIQQVDFTAGTGQALEIQSLRPERPAPKEQRRKGCWKQLCCCFSSDP